MTSAKTDVKKHFLVIVALVIGVGALAMSIHELAGIRTAAPTARLAFTLAWTAANVAIVATGLYRIRVARNAARRQR